MKKTVLGAPEYEVKFSGEWDSSGDGPALRVWNCSPGQRTSFRVRVEHPHETNPQFVKNCPKSAPVMSFQEEPRTLEQVYLKVMAEAKGGENVH